jgi:hypothetical protein
MALPRPLQTVSENARWLYPLTVLLLAAVLGHFFGLGFSLLIVAGGTLGGSIWLIWSSLQGLGGDAPITLEEALSLGAPSAEEEQKRAVLRALKDLEYERAVGKISDEDYASLAEHYRTEAKRLLRAVDRDLSPERERAERILAERLAAANAAGEGNVRRNPRAKARPAAAKAAADATASQAAKAAGAGLEGDALEAEPGAAAADTAEAEGPQRVKSPSSDAAP